MVAQPTKTPMTVLRALRPAGAPAGPAGGVLAAGTRAVLPGPRPTGPGHRAPAPGRVITFAPLTPALCEEMLATLEQERAQADHERRYRALLADRRRVLRGEA